MKSLFLILAVIGCASASFHRSLNHISSMAERLESKIRTLDRALDRLDTSNDQQLRDASRSVSSEISNIEDKRWDLVSTINRNGEGFDDDREVHYALRQFMTAKSNFDSSASQMLSALRDNIDTASRDVKAALREVNKAVSHISIEAGTVLNRYYSRH